MKRVMVTGATGFIGRRVLNPLMERGYHVTALTSGDHKPLPDGVDRVIADLADPVAVRAALQQAQPTHLLHLAWQKVQSGLWTAKENIDWVPRTLTLVRAFKEGGGKRLVVSGSCGEYDWTSGLCAEDSTPLTPSTYYGQCKHALQILLSGYSQTNGLSFAWGRAFFIYGPGEDLSRLGASVANATLRGEEALCSHGMQLRDYIHVDDLANAYAALLDCENTGAFNLATGEPIRVKELIMALARSAGREDLVRLGARPAAAHEPPLILADMTKTRSCLDWTPKFDLEQGAADTIAAMRSALGKPH